MTIALRVPKGAEPRSQTVMVRELRPSEMGRYFYAVHSMTALVELATDQEAGWADSVAPADLLALCDKVKELNDPFFVQWLTRQGPEVARLTRGVTGGLGSTSGGSASGPASPSA